MLRNLRSRRRHRYGVFLRAVVSGLLVLVSVWLLISHSHLRLPSHEVNYDSRLSDSPNDDADEDTIDALDIVEEQTQDSTEADDDDESLDQNNASGYVFHPVQGVIRAFSKSFMDDDEIFTESEDRGKTAFGSDDVAVEENVRRKAIQVNGVEDALLLKTNRRVSPLREGWGDWFDKRSDFLRKDKMFRSNLEGLNPLHNPILQDPDSVGLTGITKADKIIRNSLFNDFKRIPFPARKIVQDPNLT
ncbi:uncharacterized protein At4g19900-like [Abrus precatorius]|uniref:Uncharacterized protein At4g19900-like n=1 Tax=Abrus precatorius TaxID=3816 RepID=A0A8B8LLA0_ABRPR|nr:uncharacterized protein At4g19900-like [Abrus precatorius]